MAEREVELKIAEALQNDVGRGIVRVDHHAMEELEITSGDIVEISGKGKSTAAIVWPSHPQDIDKGIIRMDGLIRQNTNSSLGDKVKVKKSKTEAAKKVVIAPLRHEIKFGPDFTSHLKQRLLGRPLTREDNLSIGILGQAIPFVVADVNPRGIVQVQETTKIEIKEKPITVRKIPAVRYEDIGGLREELGRVREMIELPMKHPELFEKLGISPPKGVLLHGPPGTGKTLIAKAVASETNAYFIPLNGPEIMDKYYGESEKKLREMFKEAQNNAPSIIFIDEIDSIAPKREETRGEVERRVVAQLLALMDGLIGRGEVIVIAATNRVDSLDPALRRPGRFDREIEIGVPDTEGRKEILQVHTRGMPLTKDVSLEKISKITHGFVGADLEALAREAAMYALKRILPKIDLEKEEIPGEILDKLEVNKKDFSEALKNIAPSALREIMVEIPDVKWKDVGGLKEVKRDLKEAVEWPLKYPDSFKRMGIRTPRAILLYGPPGCGKTLLAKAIANEAESNFITVKGPELLSMWVGESLPGFEKIPYLNDNEFHHTPIKDLVESKKGKDIRVLSFGPDGRTSFNKVSAFIKKPSKYRYLYKVRTKRGMSIHVTKDHSLFTIGESGIESIPTSQIIPNQTYIALPKKVNPYAKKQKSINLLKLFKNSTHLRVYNGTEYLRKVAKKVGYERVAKVLGKRRRKNFDDILYRNLAMPIANFLNVTKLTSLKLEVRTLKVGVNGSYTPAIIPITKTLMEALGLWVAEGDINQKSLRLTTSDKECITMLKKLSEELDINYGIYAKSRGKAKTIYMNSVTLTMLIKKLGFTSGAFNKNVPDFIHNLDEEHIAAFLRGYLSGDACINYRKSNDKGADNVSFSTVSKELAHGISLLYRYFGIVPTIRQKVNRLGNTEYVVNFYGVENYKRFIDKIGFLQSSKNNKVREYISKKGWIRGNSLPIVACVKRFVSKHLLERVKNSSIDELSLRDKLEEVDPQKKFYPELINVLAEGIFWDKVVSMEKIKHNGNVYDLSVENGENFVSGFGGIFAHNSERGLREIFKKAKQTAPCIILFDEMDALAPRRGEHLGSHVTETVVNQLLTEMDGLESLENVVVIGSTNRPDMIDSSLMRPGRFDERLLVPAPDEEARLEIFKVHTRNMPLEKGINLSDFAKRTNNYSGADIEGICREAGMLALRENIKSSEVKKKHFEEALKKAKPSISENELKLYEGYKTGERGIKKTMPAYA